MRRRDEARFGESAAASQRDHDRAVLTHILGTSACWVRPRAVVTGNPIRAELLNGDAGRGVTALGWAGWDGSLPTVYVTGGAQGSVQVNRLVEGVLERILPRANVVHQCGSTSLADLRRRA